MPVMLQQAQYIMDFLGVYFGVYKLLCLLIWGTAANKNVFCSILRRGNKTLDSYLLIQCIWQTNNLTLDQHTQTCYLYRTMEYRNSPIKCKLIINIGLYYPYTNLIFSVLHICISSLQILPLICIQGASYSGQITCQFGYIWKVRENCASETNHSFTLEHQQTQGREHYIEPKSPELWGSSSSSYVMV